MTSTSPSTISGGRRDRTPCRRDREERMKINKKKAGWCAAGLLIAGMLAFGWKKHKSGEDKKTDWVEATRGNLTVKFQEVGDLEPKVKVDVKSNVTGRVVKLAVEAGDEIKKGQLLAVIQ